ncbi:hypothetical protein IMZ31_23085 (plasmid) [Pontibacillus sp. ALD_SL1]|uniref:hypothetical protein n=1 Tax=Pontibacillus sp. ALD_SL1 TaxID=2777185 RepID=UPI001A95DBA9|nr:hypothetical protein [Pontibacillus sp. ALD_SL1]QST02339.1 hypothetical protein IMZ31_23085 [Pontibacillus sp. ALD_SL1]
MNIYIPKKEVLAFIENFKENLNIDVYKSDVERLGKQKVSVSSRLRKAETMGSLLRDLPKHSMIVDKVEYPGKEYFLCVGEVSFSDFSALLKEKIDVSIVTKMEERLRFNGWVKYEDIVSLYETSYIFELSSINGLIKARSTFVIKPLSQHLQSVYQKARVVADEVIISGEKIYVKCSLEKFVCYFSEIHEEYNKIDIIDEDHLV